MVEQSKRGNPNFINKSPINSDEPEHIIAGFSLYAEEVDRLRQLGGLLHVHVEKAIRLYLKSSHKGRFGMDLLTNGNRQTLYVRIERTLYDQIMRTWSQEDPLALAVSEYVASKRRAA